ncbi:MAG: hypothetical protein IJ462_00570 [Clostridia bacterium]|nr:hypothetical protein [Clostridia bacterium]
MEFKRVTLFCGHYGSGKTNVAVNVAFQEKKVYNKVSVADLDIVNPYFRTKDSAKDFEEQGISLISSHYANTNLDIPALPPEIYSIVDDRSTRFIVDVGGDDRGALALGRIAPKLIDEADYEMLMVINCYRPLTPDAVSTVEVMREIETAGKIKFTGIVNNSNLGESTTVEDVLASVEYAKSVSALSGLPVKFTAVKEDLYEDVKERLDNVFPLKLQAKYFS